MSHGIRRSAVVISMVTGLGLLMTADLQPARATPPGGGGPSHSSGPSGLDWVNFGINIYNSTQRPQPYYPPQHQQPYYVPQPNLPPQVGVQPNFIPEKKVEPQKNAVPLADKLVPMRRREARCYVHSLTQDIDKAGDSADNAWKKHKQKIGEELLKGISKLLQDEDALRPLADSLRAGNLAKAREQLVASNIPAEPRAGLFKQFDAAQKIDEQVRELLAKLRGEPTWADVQKLVEGVASAIVELSRDVSANPRAPVPLDGVVTGFGGLANLLIIRDILITVLNGDPATRITPLPAGAVPTGIIRVIYDPDLPLGTGLFVNQGLMIAGTGGRGELQTATASAAEALGLPVAPGVPVPDLGKDENPPKGGILIANPDSNQGAIKYVLASAHPYEMKPGHRQLLNGDRSWLIEFDRGGRYGQARYTLSEGIYAFTVGDKGWDIVTKPLKAVIDNSDGKDPFHYVLDNKRFTVQPGETKTIESKSPVIVTFDRGQESPSRKLLNKSDTYRVAVNIETNSYDLFGSPDPDAVEKKTI